ncbi:MAG TPA: beta-ketoacyl synthase N-terminal-like domain-containing protein [Pyrinomonadaceae bacterium]|nr:beta-ketoacyl synthase N-terminal-like domain-containing protein [Pyrinomonadaceae bacterium]
MSRTSPYNLESRTGAVSGIGLATAQGGVAEILESRTRHEVSELPWTPRRWNVSRLCYPAVGIARDLTGVERWQALAKRALADLNDNTISSNTPLLVASCNGSAAGFTTTTWERAFDTSALLKETPWANGRLPVFSSSCASGLHALYAAKQLLAAGAVDEVLVLAVDILSQSNHDNFEGLRVLAEKPAQPWQPASTGFILGEAAVVVRLTKDDEFAIVLQSDLEDHDGLSGVLESISPRNVSLILGQGTGPYQNDAAELAAFSTFVGKDAPVETPLTQFGHTLGASGLLSVALGALKQAAGNVLVTCRALNGACAATLVGSPAKAQRRKDDWKRTTTAGPLMNPILRRLAAEALDHRPSTPPDVLILRLERPLAPPPAAIIGERLLPSAVLEITPGFASQLVARCWGFTGPALCLVGEVGEVGHLDSDVYGLKNAFRESGLNVFQLNLRGSGDNRAIEWNA